VKIADKLSISKAREASDRFRRYAGALAVLADVKIADKL